MKLLTCLTWLLCTFSLSACSSLLPRAEDTSSPFASFDEARRAIETIQPGVSTVAILQQRKLDPGQHPNTRLVSHAELTRRFLPSNLIERQDLDPGVWACLEARQSCQAWDITAARVKRQRTGNFLLDFINFRRRTETTGWRFQALVLLVDDVVVYRSWGGQPNINEVRINRNPLGPFQDVGPSAVTNQ